jgi:hypothetical protein
MPILQDVIHRLEKGGVPGIFRLATVMLALLMLVLMYNWRAFRNMSTQEAMDAAQLGRNIAQGKGYTTLFVRPFSIYLLKRWRPSGPPQSADSETGDPMQIKGDHPDIANPPVYPVVLAALLKVLPMDYMPSTTKVFWSNGGRFWRYEPDFVIGLFNQILMMANIVLIFFLARRLFDAPVAWLSAVLLLGTDMYWRFAFSGLSTTLLMLILTGLIWCLVLLEEEARLSKLGPNGMFLLAIAIGVLMGVGGLTRYSFAWLILPVVGFLIAFSGPRRVVLVLAALAAFGVVMGPWLLRNYHLCGMPFGTAGYSVVESTILFPEYRLQRSLDPDLNHLFLFAFWMKLIANARTMVDSDLPRLGGSWVNAFFLVGLLVGFRSPTLKRLRYFLLACLSVLFVVQALGRTQLSVDSPDINSENLLVLLAPLVLVYGVSLFFLLLDQVSLPFPELRYVVMAGYSALACLPMVLMFFPPKVVPVAYPPYYPPTIKDVGSWLKEKELAMSDVPWAMAWYGQRQCVWLTLNAQADFLAINDFQKPIVVLYLTPTTMDARFVSQWIRTGEQSWGSFILESIVKKEVPPSFPLRKAPAHFLPEQLVLTDRERWKSSP